MAGFVSVLIPAHNEATTIQATVRAVWTVSGVREVVVVDDGSLDATAFLAWEAGARVLRTVRNCGKGGAINVAGRSLQGEIVALVDGDVGTSAGELVRLLGPVASGSADMTIGLVPSQRGSGGFGLVKGVARRTVQFYTGRKLAAVLSGQRAIRRELWEQLLPVAAGYGVELDLTVRTIRLGGKVLEVEVDMTHRLTGRDLPGFRHRGRQFYDVCRAAWYCRPRRGR